MYEGITTYEVCSQAVAVKMGEVLALRNIGSPGWPCVARNPIIIKD
jgi:hypothetical protein